MKLITPYQIKQIIRLNAGGMPKAQIATRLGLHRDTVRSYTKQYPTERDYLMMFPGDDAEDDALPIAPPPDPREAPANSLGLYDPEPGFYADPFKHPADHVYLLTAAQNNTDLHEAFWANLKAYAEYRGAEILVGGFVYRKDAQGQRGQEKAHEDEAVLSDKATKQLVWDARLDAYRADERRMIGPGLVWMGQMNALPTNVDPLSGLTNYSRGDSAVYPHVKVAMRSIATAPGTDPKFLYTTGAVTQPNYIQRKGGQIAEFHHIIGALIVEVTGDDWFARQINATDDGAFQDLDMVVKGGRVTDGHSLFAVNWGDIHERKLTDDTVETMGVILDETRPQYQFFNDLVDAESANPHSADDHLQRYKLVMDLKDDVRVELDQVSKFLARVDRPGTVSVVVPSNHDDMIIRWLKRVNHKTDPRNMRFYHEASLAALDQIDAGEGVDLLKWHLGPKHPNVIFIPPNRPTFILKGIEFGQHGHLGPNGNHRMTAKGYTILAIKINKGHDHTAAIYDGVFSAGVMELEHGYNIGYSSWSRSIVLTYHNGKRTIVTLRGNSYRGATR